MTPAPPRIGVVGCGGRVGRLLVDLLRRDPVNCSFSGGTTRTPDPALPFFQTRSIAKLAARSDVLIDFTTPDIAVSAAAACREAGIAFVSGTTGLTGRHDALLRDAATAIPVLHSANMSVGVAVLSALVGQAAARLGPEWDIEILETHHRMKADAPSGTALLLGRAAAAGRDIPLDDNADRARDGITGPRRPGRIGFAVRRGGDVVGEHAVGFYGAGERIELSHVATDRRLFAQGAVQAALWAARQPPGFYTLANMLNL